MNAARGIHRKRFKGRVVSAGSMARTVTVEVEFFPRHRKLRTQYRRTKRYLVDDPGGKVVVGDRVVCEETRPISRRKHFRVLSIGSHLSVVP